MSESSLVYFTWVCSAFRLVVHRCDEFSGSSARVGSVLWEFGLLRWIPQLSEVSRDMLTIRTPGFYSQLLLVQDVPLGKSLPLL